VDIFPKHASFACLQNSLSNDVLISRLITSLLGLFANPLIDFSRAEKCPNSCGWALQIHTMSIKKYIYTFTLFEKTKEKSITKYSPNPAGHFLTVNGRSSAFAL
jgi:hypothetical protein